MAIATLVRDLNLDRYDRNARLQPALLVLLPLIALTGVWYPASRTGAGWIASLLVTCGATFLLAQATRRRGRALERAWGDRIGRRHSARLLSAADDTLPAAQKSRIAAWVDKHGPGVPSAEDELLDPQSAADRRLTAIGWMLEITRADAATSMLLAENVSYGFWRNMRGLRPVGISVASIAVAIGVLLALRAGTGDERFWPGVAAATGATAVLAGWVWLVSRRAVVDASLAYAERLFAQIDNPAVAQRLRSGATSGEKAQPRRRKAAPSGDR